MKLSTCHAMVKTEALVAGALPSTSTLFSKFGRNQLQGRQVGRVEFPQQQISVGRSAMVRIRASGGKEVYQPFRPPVSTDPAPLGASSTEDQLEVLRDRRGLWHEYASIIPLLARKGYSPAMIDEATGMTGVEQNMVVVAAQVRSSLKTTGFDDESLRWFDLGGAELLYELRILSAQQRRASAELVVERNMGPKEVTELARSVKDFDRRKAAEGHKDFTSAPGDCLSFACYRQSKEFSNPTDAEMTLKKALDFCVTEKARAKIEKALEKLTNPTSTSVPDVAETSFLQVIRLLENEAVGTKLPTMLPVADATRESLEAVPALPPRGSGPFNVFSSDAVWPSWVALPGWDPVVGASAPVAVIFPDPLKLPLQSNKNGVAKLQEPTLLVVDKDVTEVAEGSDQLYVVSESEESQDLSIKSGSRVLGARVLGRVIIALRPPVPASQDPIDWE